YLVRMFICLLCVNDVHSTCAECTSWLCYVYYVLLCCGRFGRRLVIRISVPSLTLCHFVPLTNKRLVTCNLYISGGKSHTLGCNPVARGPGSILFYRERRSEC